MTALTECAAAVCALSSLAMSLLSLWHFQASSWGAPVSDSIFTGHAGMSAVTHNETLQAASCAATMNCCVARREQPGKQ
jgi:hypothetical protein